MRVGPHVNNLPAWGQGLIRFKSYVERVRPPMVKFIDTGFNDDAIAFAVACGCQVVGRIVFDDGDQPIDNDAKRRIARIVESTGRHPQITWWEFYNEAYEKGDEMAKYAERSIEFMQAMEAVGKKALIGGFSTGTPDESQWPRFRPAVEYAWRKGHGICLHQYSAPDMRYMAGNNQWNNGSPRLDDPVLDPKAEGWHTLRHRKALKVFESWGVSARFFIGESGNDDIQQRPGGPGKGWKDWRSSSLKLGDFADQLRWLGWQFSHDPSVIGWVDYGWGSTDGGDERWKHFDLSSDTTMLDRVATLQLELPRLHFGAPLPTTPPVTPPTPTPPSGGDPVSDKLAALLEARLGDRFTDVRASMPRHASLRFGQLDPAKLRGIAVHHSAGPRDQTPAQIAAYHISKTDPFAGIGYHFVIRRGHVYYVGDVATQRAHVAGRNDVLLGICITGDYTQETPHAEDTTALRDLVAGLDAQLGRALPVDGHGAYALAGHGTQCPGALAPVARAIRAESPPGPGPVVDYRKVVWAIEQGVRILEGEGRTVDAGYIRSTYLADAIKRRDGKA